MRARRRSTARRLVKRDGKDPIAERGRAKMKTFKEAAEALIESKRPGWRNAKHAKQWNSTLEAYVYPKIGAPDVQGVDTSIAGRPYWLSPARSCGTPTPTGNSMS